MGVGVHPGKLEEPLRHAARSTYNHAVAFGSLSIVATAALVPLVLVGHVLLGVTYTVGTILERGTPHTAREAVGLFLTGMRRGGRDGVVLTAVLFGLTLILAGNLAVLSAPETGPVAGSVVLASTLLVGACAASVVHLVVLLAWNQPLAESVYDAAVLAVLNPLYTLLQAIVVVSCLVLGALSLFVGWLVVGFAFTAAFVALATDRLYEEQTGCRPLRAIGTHSAG
jgi:uncharacterized membrane protein YesL